MKWPVFTNNSIHTEFNPTEEKNEKLKLNKIKFSCGFNKILDIELEVIKYKVELSKTNENDNKTHILWQ